MLMPTLASDNFTRANENPISDGGNWSQWSSVTNWGPAQILSNKAEAVGLVNADTIRTGTTWPNDQWSEVTVGACLGLSYVGASVRMSAVAQTGYRCYWNGTQGNSSTLYIQKGVSGSFTPLATASITINAGDKIRAVAIGTRIFVLVNGVQVLSAVDASIASGYAGFVVTPITTATNALLSGWSGGSVVQQNRITTFTDNFTRANQNPIASGWSTFVETTSLPLQVLSNVCRATSAGNRNASFVSATAPDNQWAEVTASNTVPSGGAPAVFVRGVSGGGAWNYYRFVYSGNQYFIQRWTVNGGSVFVAIATSPTGLAALATNDVMRVEVSGSIITGFLNNVPVVLCIDTFIPSGKPGAHINPGGSVPSVGWSLFNSGVFSNQPNFLMMMGCGT